MIELKSPAEIERMHVTGQFVARMLSELLLSAMTARVRLFLFFKVTGKPRQRG